MGKQTWDKFMEWVRQINDMAQQGQLPQRTITYVSDNTNTPRCSRCTQLIESIAYCGLHGFLCQNCYMWTQIE